MNERVIFSDFISSFANSKKGDKQNIEKLLTSLFELIEKSLLVEKVVKVRHIGTFKLDWFEPRKITNVNTGEISEIGGYYRLAFTPDKEMAAAVNENYSHLQAISLTNGLEAVSEREEEILDSVDEEAREEESSVSEKNFVPLNEIKEELLDAQTIMQEIAAMNEEKPAEESTSETDEMDLLGMLYESEAKNMFSERYARLAEFLKEDNKETSDATQTKASNDAPSVDKEGERSEAEPVAETIVVEECEEKTVNETTIEAVFIEEIIQEIALEQPIEEPIPIDPLESIVAEADKFRASLFVDQSVVVENEEPTDKELTTEQEVEPLLVVDEIVHKESSPEPTTKAERTEEVQIEEIHEPRPYQAKQMDEPTSIVASIEPIEAKTPIDQEAVQPKTNKENGEEPTKRQYSKWSIVGIVFTILLIIATFGYIYSEYFNKGKEAKPNIFEQTYKSVIKLFEPKSVEIELNDMTLSRKDSSKTDRPKVEKEPTNVPTSPQAHTESAEKQTAKNTPIPPTTTAEDKVVKVDFAETLSSIARREYGSRFFWCYIYEANKAKIPNINNLRSGIELIIPNKERLAIDPNNEASLNRAKERCLAIERELKNQ